MTTWGQLEEVKSVDIASIDSWEVSGNSLDKVVLVSINKERSLSNYVSGVSDLSVSNSDLLTVFSS